MAGNEVKTDFTKTVLAALLGMVLTGATSWIIFGQDKVSRSELLWQTENQGPWVRDKADVMAQIKAVGTVGARLEATVDRLSVQVQDLVTEQRVLTEKLSRVLTQK